MEPTRFIHSRWIIFEMRMEMARGGPGLDPGTVFRRISDFTMSTHEVAGRPIALVQMPMPEKPVEAYLVAVALLAPAAHAESWSRDVQARVFTLEAEVHRPPEKGGIGVFCEWTKDGTHKNFGSGVRAEHEAFLQAVSGALPAL